MAKALSVCRSSLVKSGSNVIFFQQATKLSGSATVAASNRKLWLSALGVAAATGGLGVWYALEKSVNASEIILHPVKLPWSHGHGRGWRGLFDTFDHQSIRRGYQVYKQVCAACHSLNQLYYRHFVDVFMTEDEAKADAAEIQVEDGPNDQGKMYMREGKLFDKIPDPYPNEQAARNANNGAAPPDFSWIVNARHAGEHYIFALLTGYQDCPAGIQLGEGQAYNPYFPGGAIGMPQQLFDGGIEYEDGTPATQSQQAKDVATFLTWCSLPEHDTRRLYLLKLAFFFPIVTALLLYWKKHTWTYIKNQQFVYKTLPGREAPKKV